MDSPKSTWCGIVDGLLFGVGDHIAAGVDHFSICASDAPIGVRDDDRDRRRANDVAE